MLIGQHIHTLDPKKRMSLPAKFRAEMGKTVIVARGWDKCVAVYSVKQWKETVAKFTGLSEGQADSRKLSRYILGTASETDVDSAGRILIPDMLKEFAGLSEKVVVVGLENHVELWDEESWTEYQKRASVEAEKIAEKLADTGAL
ncbi:MAG: division/cell wall cluster transcriptional repressor MraZ [Candidatus Yonathbacteria bacterium]|nr:division/cell wall cluster transcriptional repressor MraZ [Candidatus Yonathbacteria bacterium]